MKPPARIRKPRKRNRKRIISDRDAPADGRETGTGIARLAGRFNRPAARVSALSVRRPGHRQPQRSRRESASHVPPRPAFACPPGAPLYNGVSRFNVGESRRDGRVAEGARLESVYTGNRIVGSNPTLSASAQLLSTTIVSGRQRFRPAPAEARSGVRESAASLDPASGYQSDTTADQRRLPHLIACGGGTTRRS